MNVGNKCLIITKFHNPIKALIESNKIENLCRIFRVCIEKGILYCQKRKPFDDVMNQFL